MPQKIIYTSRPTQIYRLKESESLTRFLNLQAYLEIYLPKREQFREAYQPEPPNLEFFFLYKNTVLELIHSKRFNKIKAFGTEKHISAAERFLSKKLLQAEASYKEMYGAQPFLQNEKMQKMFDEAVRIRHEQVLSNAKNI